MTIYHKQTLLGMVRPLLQELCCGVPGMIPGDDIIIIIIFVMMTMAMTMMMTMMMMTSHHPRKMGRKEMAVGTIHAKAIIRQATLTVMMMMMMIIIIMIK